MRIAINGMGRIGRLLFRRLVSDPQIQLVAVNDLMEAENLFYLLKYDSVYGTFAGKIRLQGDAIFVGNKEIHVLNQPDASRLPWSDLGVNIVLECTGKYTTKERAAFHLQAGADRVLLSTTGTDDIPLMIYGFNQHQLTDDVKIVSPGGCMTNCSTHILYILNSIGIESAQLHFLHSYTSRQELVDTAHRQYRRGRAAAESIIPVEIDLAHSLQRLLTPLQDRVATISSRVPVANGALADFTIQMKHPVHRQEINLLFQKAASGEYKKIIDYTDEQVVSTDIRGNSHSAVVDGSLTSVVHRQLKLFAWFDNEYGYTSRMIDWLRYMGEKGRK
jgi:glyceraldehyde 3-phosphate dehydrogenase